MKTNEAETKLKADLRTEHKPESVNKVLNMARRKWDHRDRYNHNRVILKLRNVSVQPTSFYAHMLTALQSATCVCREPIVPRARIVHSVNANKSRALELSQAQTHTMKMTQLPKKRNKDSSTWNPQYNKGFERSKMNGGRTKWLNANLMPTIITCGNSLKMSVQSMGPSRHH